MSELAVDWVNRVGLLLQFLAFWFFYPELEERRAFERIEGWAEKHAVGFLGFLGSREGASVGAGVLILIFIPVYGFVTHEWLEGLIYAIVVPGLFVAAAVLVFSVLQWVLRFSLWAGDQIGPIRFSVFGAILFAVGALAQFVATF